MKYNIRGDKMIVTDAINSYVESKLGKLDKYFRNDEIRANVLLKVRGANRQIIEVTIPTEKFILRCEEENNDLHFEQQCKSVELKTPLYQENYSKENLRKILQSMKK